MAFLIVSGLLEKRIVALIVSVIVGFLSGGTLLSGVLPLLGSHVSWDGHLFGAIAGGIIACALTRERRPHGASAGIGHVDDGWFLDQDGHDWAPVTVVPVILPPPGLGR